MVCQASLSRLKGRDDGGVVRRVRRLCVLDREKLLDELAGVSCIHGALCNDEESRRGGRFKQSHAVKSARGLTAGLPVHAAVIVVDADHAVLERVAAHVHIAPAADEHACGSRDFVGVAAAAWK